MRKINISLKNKNFKFITFILICLGIVLISVLINNNKSRTKQTTENIIIKTDDLNLEYDEIPKEHIAISVISPSEILLKTNDTIWLYDRDKKEKKLISKVLNKDHVFGKVIYDNQWVIWIEDSDKVLDGSEIGRSWIVAAKNISTNEQIIIDESREIENLKYRYAPDDIEVSNDNIVYAHTDVQDDEYVFLVKTFNLLNGNLEVIEKIVDLSDKYITDVSIYKNKVVWSNPNTLNFEGSKKYRYSDLYIYDLNSKEKTKFTMGEYMLHHCIYEDKIYAVNHTGFQETQLVEIDINTRKRKIIIDNTKPIFKEIGGATDGMLTLFNPSINSNLLTWWSSQSNEKGIYYDLKDNKSKTIGNNKYINLISNGYIIYTEYDDEDNSETKIVPIEQ